MLKALHALQKENQRLQEQILSLTAKKERLQILNVQLSVPFPALPAVLPAANGPVPGPYGLPPQGKGSPPSPGVGAFAGQQKGVPTLALTCFPDPLSSAGSSDSLSTSKSPPGKNSLGLDNSLSTSSEVGTAGRGSRAGQKRGGARASWSSLHPAAIEVQTMK